MTGLIGFVQAWLHMLLGRLPRRELGQGTVEYAIIVAVVAVIAVAVLGVAPGPFGAALSAAYGAMQTAVTTAVGNIG